MSFTLSVRIKMQKSICLYTYLFKVQSTLNIYNIYKTELLAYIMVLIMILAFL